jgi:hypothetical protein
MYRRYSSHARVHRYMMPLPMVYQLLTHTLLCTTAAAVYIQAHAKWVTAYKKHNLLQPPYNIPEVRQ